MLKLIATGYSDNDSCEEIFIDNNLNVVKRCVVDGIFTASFVELKSDDTYFVSEESKEYARIHEVSDGKIIKTFDLDTLGVVYLRFLKKWDIMVSGSYSSGDVITGDKKIFSGSTIHCVVADEAESFLYVTDIKNDRIFIYDLNNKRVTDEVILSKGCGPRHLFLYKKFLYLVTEYSNEIYVFLRNDTNGKLEFIDKYFSLGIEYKNINYAAAIDIKDNILAVSNRGKNVVSFFDILEDGRLKYLYEISCMGDWPRDIKFFGDYLFVANERSNEICVFKDDKLVLKIDKVGVNCLQIVEEEF